MIQKRTIGIVEAGSVGMEAAYAMFLKQSAGDIILIDKDINRAEGEAMDLMHGQPPMSEIYPCVQANMQTFQKLKSL